MKICELTCAPADKNSNSQSYNKSYCRVPQKWEGEYHLKTRPEYKTYTISLNYKLGNFRDGHIY